MVAKSLAKLFTHIGCLTVFPAQSRSAYCASCFAQSSHLWVAIHHFQSMAASRSSIFDPDRILEAAESQINTIEYQTAMTEPPWEGEQAC